jgi:mandelate racemase
VTIRGLRVRPLDVPLANPVETAGGVMRSAPIVLIDVLTDEGVSGHAYVRCYTPVALHPLAGLIANLEELIVGGPADPAAVQAKLGRHFRLLGAPGLVAMALAGIDMALWDARAREAGVSLVRLLGGEPKPVRAYAGLRSMEPRAAAAEAEGLLELGFDAIKVKVGGGDLAADLEAIGALRAAVGDAVALMVDYNQVLSVDEALARVRALDEQGLHWIEEPTRADDFAGHARIAAAADTAIQLGENWWGPHDMEKSVDARASDHAMLDAMRIGGVTGWLRAADLAERAGLPVSSHAFPELSAHLLAVTPTPHRLEYFGGLGSLLLEPLGIENGHALIPDRPGSGVEWDEERLARVQAGPTAAA